MQLLAVGEVEVSWVVSLLAVGEELADTNIIRHFPFHHKRTLLLSVRAVRLVPPQMQAGGAMEAIARSVQ